MIRVGVSLGQARVACLVARTTTEQALGLQGRPTLDADEGMLFPFSVARTATFHMGQVAFPIDLVFVDVAGRVARIVHAAQPGTKQRWSQNSCAAVIETQGGFCARTGLHPGDVVRVAGSKVGSGTYNLLQGLTHNSDTIGPGYYGEPAEDRPALTPEVAPGDRFKDHKMPDERQPASDETMAGYESNWGYQRPGDEQDAVGPLRPGTAALEVDEGEMTEHIVEATMGIGLQWLTTPLNDLIELAYITQETVRQWLEELQAMGYEFNFDRNFDFLTSDHGLDLLSRVFLAADRGTPIHADLAQVRVEHGRPIIMLTRGRTPK